mmetsp:Transcript_64767/g.192989  ORF Transcript_64767/g.192989 Transcript_64767/m.192989 type:complete len:211 (-) Transcript_64767:1271-1903(-)
MVSCDDCGPAALLGHLPCGAQRLPGLRARERAPRLLPEQAQHAPEEPCGVHGHPTVRAHRSGGLPDNGRGGGLRAPPRPGMRAVPAPPRHVGRRQVGAGGELAGPGARGGTYGQVRGPTVTGPLPFRPLRPAAATRVPPSGPGERESQGHAKEGTRDEGRPLTRDADRALRAPGLRAGGGQPGNDCSGQGFCRPHLLAAAGGDGVCGDVF